MQRLLDLSGCLVVLASLFQCKLGTSKTLEEVLKWLISPNAMELFPHLSLAAAIAFTAPVQTADVERLFSALMLVKTPLQNRLTDCHLDVCCRVAIDGPQPGTFRMDSFIRRFYRSNSIR